MQKDTKDKSAFLQFCCSFDSATQSIEASNWNFRHISGQYPDSINIYFLLFIKCWNHCKWQITEKWSIVLLPEIPEIPDAKWIVFSMWILSILDATYNCLQSVDCISCWWHFTLPLMAFWQEKCECFIQLEAWVLSIVLNYIINHFHFIESHSWNSKKCIQCSFPSHFFNLLLSQAVTIRYLNTLFVISKI